jgi:hypothetical protein
MSKLRKFGIVVLSIPLLAGLAYASWCVWENYQTGDWSESCGSLFTNPRYRACKQRRVWIPRIDYDALAKKYGGTNVPTTAEEAGPWTKYASDSFFPDENLPTMWVVVDPFQQLGGGYVQPAPPLPEEIRMRRCVAGSHLWHGNYQWICVRDEVRPRGLPDNAIVVPRTQCWNEKGKPIPCN